MENPIREEPKPGARSIFACTSYREYLRAWVGSEPKAGWGAFRRISELLRIQPSVLSQIMHGHRALGPERGLVLAQYLGLAPDETEFFIHLILAEEAGSVALKEHLSKNLARLKRARAVRSY